MGRRWASTFGAAAFACGGLRWGVGDGGVFEIVYANMRVDIVADEDRHNRRERDEHGSGDWTGAGEIGEVGLTRAHATYP